MMHEARIVVCAWNQVELLEDATAHAGRIALTQAEAAMEDWGLADCDLCVTKKP